MRIKLLVSIMATGTILSSCGSPAETADDDMAADTAFVFPASLSPFGDGYPAAGDQCRQRGESAAVADYLDDSATLVGCPTEAEAAALGGSVVATIDGVTLVSVPMGDANAGMETAMAGDGDALVPGTDYNATTTLSCTVGANASAAMCDAGVKRGWGDDGTTLVEVTKPDGTKRAIYFQGTEAYGADSAQADGSAGWDFEATRSGDESTIVFGPERYVIPDALVVGG